MNVSDAVFNKLFADDTAADIKPSLLLRQCAEHINVHRYYVGIYVIHFFMFSSVSLSDKCAFQVTDSQVTDLICIPCLWS